MVMHLVILASVGTGHLLGLLGRRARVIGAVCAVAAIGSVPWPRASPVLPLGRHLLRWEAAPTYSSRQPVLPSASRTDLARLVAGTWLAEHAAPGEGLITYNGLSAFAFGGPVFDVSGLNSPPSSPLREGAAYWIVEDGAPPPEGDWVLVGTHRYAEPGDAPPQRGGAVGFHVWARPESRIARSGVVHEVAGRTTTSVDPADVPLTSRAWRAYLESKTSQR